MKVLVMANKNVNIYLLMVLVATNLYCCSATKYNEGWCVTDTGASWDDLQRFVDYGCSVFDCSPIQPGGACYEPNGILGHAAWVLDKAYREGNVCAEGLGFITLTNPSYESCQYP